LELIRINDRKLKIMLTPSDMTHFEMNAQRLGEDTEQMRKSFRMLMKEVRRKIDFELDDRRVSVQYFPSREGGCEMFVSCSLKRIKSERLPFCPNRFCRSNSKKKMINTAEKLFIRSQAWRIFSAFATACKGETLKEKASPTGTSETDIICI